MTRAVVFEIGKDDSGKNMNKNLLQMKMYYRFTGARQLSY